MRLIEVVLDPVGRPISKTTVEIQQARLTTLQLHHLELGMEVVVIVGKRFAEYRLAGLPPQSMTGRGRSL